MLWTNTPPKIAAVAAWLLAIVFIGIVGGSHIVPQLLSLYDLAKSNRVTRGEIIETYPQMHSTCKYRYLVDGQVYEQIGQSCGDTKVGQQVVVYFSPAEPSKSLNVNPAA